ncbi:MAG: hypothetical protein LBM13_05580 [Candidatus Ancillula sp.]|jgi:hypothetical protein|nr:hypothetical protein [Candidatus Ancillula sp.]
MTGENSNSNCSTSVTYKVNGISYSNNLSIPGDLQISYKNGKRDYYLNEFD